MKSGWPLLCLLLAAAPLAAQFAAPTATSPKVESPSTTATLSDLDRLQTAASQAALDIGHLRIEKWKVDGEVKRQAQSNADSVQRNLTSALPGLIAAVRASPQDLNAEFKLYRNLNAVYDVLGTLTESVGAFGPRSDYEALAQSFQVIGSVRHNLGDALEQLTVSTQAELTRLRDQVRAQHNVTAAPAAPPKKVVVDDTEPAQKAVRKKKKPAASSNSPDASGASSSDKGGSPPQS